MQRTKELYDMLKYYKQEMRDLRNPESGRVREVYKVLLHNRVTEEEFMEYMTQHSSFSKGETAAACITIANFLAELLAHNGSVTLPGIGTFSVGIQPKEGKAKGFLEKTVTMSATGMPIGTSKISGSSASGSTGDDSLSSDSGATNSSTTNGSATNGSGTDETNASAGLSGGKETSHDINARSIQLSRINFRASEKLFLNVDRRLDQSGGLQRSREEGHVPLYAPKIASRLQRFAAAREFLQTHPYLRIADYIQLTGLSYTTAQRELKLASSLTHSGLEASGRGCHRVYVLRKNE